MAQGPDHVPRLRQHAFERVRGHQGHIRRGDEHLVRLRRQGCQSQLERGEHVRLGKALVFLKHNAAIAQMPLQDSALIPGDHHNGGGPCGTQCVDGVADDSGAAQAEQGLEVPHSG